jgi:serine/threonine protein phosphatase PrpC
MAELEGPNQEFTVESSDLSTAEFDRAKLLQEITSKRNLLSGVNLDCIGIFTDLIPTQFGQLTYLFDRGSRSTQEDALGFIHTEDRISLIIADGVGGIDNGSIVSHQVTSNCMAIAERQALVQTLKENATKITEGICSLGATTLSVVDVSKDGKLQAAHVGDSPYWIIRNGECIYKNKLHTLYESFHDQIMQYLNDFKFSNGSQIDRPADAHTLITKSNIVQLVSELASNEPFSDSTYRQIIFNWAENLADDVKKIVYYRILNETEITRTVQAFSEIYLEFSNEIKLNSGDVVIISTDGVQPQCIEYIDNKPQLKLGNLINTKDICKVVNAANGDTEQIAISLQKFSRDRNGRDNLAMIVFKYEPKEVTSDGRWKIHN